MKFVFPLVVALLSFAALPALAQRELHDIPDPRVEAQLKAFKLIDGAKISLFASEPDIVNPIQMNWDADGRLWVVCSKLYPLIQPGAKEEDRIVVLEDTNGDGVADNATNFASDLHIPTAVLPGDGGAYVANSTEVLFLKDTDGDGVADQRHIVLSGFGTEDTHHLVHTFRWGPEGMLWMNQSIYIHTHLETPYGIRRLLGGGMWHYRPETRRAEVFMKGLVNPWGHAFDQWGQSFMTDGAGTEGIHFVFPRSVYLTSPGATRILHGMNPGQPKHCGLEFLDSPHVPDSLRGTLAAPDFRGNRINLFRLTDQGSSYLSTQLADLVSSSHGAFRPIDVKMGPDGAIYVADWYNPIIQHGEVDFRDPRRDHTHGRIWRITFEGRPLDKAPKISGVSESELVAQLSSDSAWARNAATVELRSRPAENVLAALDKASAPANSDPELFALRKVWASQIVNHFDHKAAVQLVHASHPKIRAAALRALYYDAADHPETFAVASEAIHDPDLQVRLWAVSVLAQCPSSDTVKVALGALDGVTADEELDFAVWSICREHADRWRASAAEKNPFSSLSQLLFAVRALNEPVAVGQILSAMESGTLSTDGDIASIADWIAKVGSADDLARLFRFAMVEKTTPSQQLSLLSALKNAAEQRKLQPTGDLSELSHFLQSDQEALFEQAASLAGHWKLEAARPALAKALQSDAGSNERLRATLDGLVTLGGPDTAKLLEQIARDPKASYRLRSFAAIGRATTHPKLGAALALIVLADSPDGHDPFGIYDSFLSRKGAVTALTEALAETTLPQAIALTGVNKAKGSSGGTADLIAALEKAGNLTAMKTALSPDEMAAVMKEVASQGDPHLGEAIYRRPALQCTVCHAIGGIGGKIGPDLVSIGASAPVDYLIESLLEPSKKIKEGYHTVLVTRKDGTSFAGAIAREDTDEVVIRDAAGKENRIPKSEVAKQEISPVSLMPPGLTASLREDEFVNLVRFLSELGKDGAFQTTPTRYIRQWQTMHPHSATQERSWHYGYSIFTQAVADYAWTPIYSIVSGAIPAAELPDVVGKRRDNLGVIRTYLDAKSAGPVKIKVTGQLSALELFIDEEAVPLPKEGSEATLTLNRKEAGRFLLTLVGSKAQNFSSVSVELLDDSTKIQTIDLQNF